MVKVILKSWNVGMQKVAVSKLLSQEASLTLSDAKHIVDGVLDEKMQIINVESLEKAYDLAEKITALGVNCEVQEDDAFVM